MPVQREHLEANVKRYETFLNNTYYLHFQLKLCQVQKEGQHAVVEEGNVSIEKRIDTEDEKTVKSALTDRTESTSEPRVGAGDGS